MGSSAGKPTNNNTKKSRTTRSYEIDPAYGKGEMSLDLFLENTYEDGKKSSIDAITVFRP